MASPHRQLSLAEDPDKLKKSCICMSGNRRCTRKRFHAGDDETYQELLDDITTYWAELDVAKRDSTALKFSEYSVCGPHLKENRHYDVKAAILAEKVATHTTTPSRPARKASTQANITVHALQTPAKHAHKSTDSSAPRESSSDDDDDSEDDTAMADSDIEDELGPGLAAATYASSQTLTGAQTGYSSSANSSLPARPPSSAFAPSSPERRRRPLRLSSSEYHMPSRTVERFSTTAPFLGTSSIMRARTPSPINSSDATESDCSTTTIRTNNTKEIRQSIAAPPTATDIRVAEWLRTHQVHFLCFLLGGATCLNIAMVTFIVWAASRP